jgi:hypothetical protein
MISIPCLMACAPIHQFFLDVKVMRLTATEPTDGTALMGANGRDELDMGPVANLLNE